ncbi:plant invertase/pectin methylesterase inhibitor [Striga asiatica]|uniref:Plant invertase/pectin methylesterase inhibitor n=1 Tax=Striga asiatica TaxID=4170 RepID=A0A5A7Q7W7_STRAF|nr:plant invertase/pectin methylesterase inhibitor [Striga asiatica]
MDSGISRRPLRSRRRTSSADPLFAKFGFDSVTNLATESSGERLHHIPAWWPPRTLMSDAVSLGGEDERFGVVDGLIEEDVSLPSRRRIQACSYGRFAEFGSKKVRHNYGGRRRWQNDWKRDNGARMWRGVGKTSHSVRRRAKACGPRMADEFESTCSLIDDILYA